MMGRSDLLLIESLSVIGFIAQSINHFCSLAQNHMNGKPTWYQHAPRAPVSQCVCTLRARNLLAASRAGEGLLRVADVLDALGVEVVAASKPPRFLVVHLKAHDTVLFAIAFVRCRSTGSVALLAIGSPAVVLADRSTAALLALGSLAVVLADRSTAALLAPGSPAAVGALLLWLSLSLRHGYGTCCSRTGAQGIRSRCSPRPLASIASRGQHRSKTALIDCCVARRAILEEPS